MKRLLAELKRRNVWRAAILYAGAIWALAQGIAQLGPSFGMPDWGTRWFVVAGVIGFPFWVAFAWFFEWTPEGLKRERDVGEDASITRRTGRKLDLAIIAVLAIAVVLLLTDRFVAHRDANVEPEVATSDKSIAVLPFVDMSQAKDQEYFSDGIAEDLLNLLTRIPSLQVAARTSSFSFKGKNVPIPDIARALRVANVLEGSVRKSGNEVRITTELVRASDGYEIWSQSWDRKLDDIFAIQDEIAAAIVSQLRVTLLGEVPKAKAIDPAAYPLILQGDAFINQGSRDSFAHAIDAYRQAVAIAPDAARAWSGLARAYLNQCVVGAMPSSQGEPLIRESAGKALAIDPADIVALAIMARMTADFEFDLPAAALYYQRALAQEPGNLVAINGAAILSQNIGRIDQALALNEYRLAHDPANPIAHSNLGNALATAGRWDASIDAYRSALRLSPGLSSAHYSIALAMLLGKHDGAGALAEVQAEPDEFSRLLGMPLALHALGRTQEADAAVREFADKMPYQYETIASIYAYLGDRDATFQWLDKAATARDPSLSTTATSHLYDGVHDDARWVPFLRRIGYAPDQLAKIEFKVTLPEAVPTTAGPH